MISYYLAILRRRGLLVLLVSLIYAPLIFWTLTSGPETYTSRAVIQVGTGSATEGLINESGAYQEPERRIATELEVIAGRTVAEEAAGRLRAVGVTDDVDELMDNVEATPRGGASAIEVSGTASTARRAQQVTEAVVDAYIDYRRDSGREELEQVQADLRQRLDATAVAADSQSRYDTLAEWLEAVTLRLSVDTSGLEVISSASLPDEPAGGVSPVVAGLAAAVGALLLGCGAALVVDLARGGVRTREEAEALVSAPVLAEVPGVHGGPDAWAAALSDATHPTSVSARALRLRLASLSAPASSRVMIVGTQDDGLDTVTVAAALGVSCSRAGLRTLLIADRVRGAGLQQLLGAAGNGVPVAGGSRLEVAQTVLPNLWTASATSPETGPAGVLDAADPGSVLDVYADAFSVIVFALPPSADAGEAVALGHLVQDIVVVCALGRSPAKRLRRLLGALSGAGLRVCGLALTTKARRIRRRPTGKSAGSPDRVPIPTA